MCQLALYDEFVVDGAGSGEEALRVLSAGQLAAVLIDAPLSDLDEAAFCRRARRQGARIPLVVLGEGGDAAIVLALDAGAIDYIAKPVRVNVLMARLRTHLRQYEQREAASIPMGRFLLRVGEELLVGLAAGAEIQLTSRETDLLKYLYRAGQPVSPAKLLADVWGYHAGVDTHTVQTHVHRLRRKIGDDRRNALLIVTDERGYRLAESASVRPRAA